MPRVLVAKSYGLPVVSVSVNVGRGWAGSSSSPRYVPWRRRLGRDGRGRRFRRRRARAQRDRAEHRGCCEQPPHDVAPPGAGAVIEMTGTSSRTCPALSKRSSRLTVSPALSVPVSFVQHDVTLRRGQADRRVGRHLQRGRLRLVARLHLGRVGVHAGRAGRPAVRRGQPVAARSRRCARSGTPRRRPARPAAGCTRRTRSGRRPSCRWSEAPGPGLAAAAPGPFWPALSRAPTTSPRDAEDHGHRRGDEPAWAPRIPGAAGRRPAPGRGWWSCCSRCSGQWAPVDVESGSGGLLLHGSPPPPTGQGQCQRGQARRPARYRRRRTRR